VLNQWFIAKHSEGKPITGHMSVHKAKSFCDEKKTDDSTHSPRAGSKIFKNQQL
jgi:hypothetical protein